MGSYSVDRALHIDSEQLEYLKVSFRSIHRTRHVNVSMDNTSNGTCDLRIDLFFSKQYGQGLRGPAYRYLQRFTWSEPKTVFVELNLEPIQRFSTAIIECEVVCQPRGPGFHYHSRYFQPLHAKRSARTLATTTKLAIPITCTLHSAWCSPTSKASCATSLCFYTV